MAIRADFKFDREGFRRHLQKHLMPVVDRASVRMQSEVKRTLNRARAGGSAPGQPPGKDTGTLGRSIQIDRRHLSKLKNTVGTKLVYAAIHEFGGTIRAKRAKMLAVPIGVAGRRAARRSGGDIRSLDLTLIPRKGKPPLLVKKQKTRWTLMFVLKKSVRIPKRPYIRPTLTRIRPQIEKLVATGARRAIVTYPGTP